MIESKVNRRLLKEMVANANVRFRYIHCIYISYMYIYVYYHFSLSIIGTNVKSSSLIWIHQMSPYSSFQLGLVVRSTCSIVYVLLCLFFFVCKRQMPFFLFVAVNVYAQLDSKKCGVCYLC